MSFYYGKSEPPPDEEGSGCRDVLLLTRAAFGVLLIPLGILFGALLSVAVIVYLFSHSWLLGLLGLVLGGVGIYLYARWERRHFHAQ